MNVSSRYTLNLQRTLVETSVPDNVYLVHVFHTLRDKTPSLLQINTDSISYLSESDVIQANFRNMFMVSVDLMPSHRKRTTSITIMAEGYEISLSYDSKKFGQSVNIILYNESSYSCNSKSIACFELVC